MIHQFLKSSAIISPRLSSGVRNAISSRTNATKKEQNPENIMRKSGDRDQNLTGPCVKKEGGDHVYVETKHFHDEVKDVEDGHVHVEVMDVDIKVAKKCKIGMAQQPDYSGKLWEDGSDQSAENVIKIDMDDPTSHQLPKDWDMDMQDPMLKVRVEIESTTKLNTCTMLT
uniref:Uncharacterized protein n=1 Tax=Ditylenchus dipsaci TaxID=166011 RepID=A0A915ECZ4_9BILA